MIVVVENRKQCAKEKASVRINAGIVVCPSSNNVLTLAGTIDFDRSAAVLSRKICLTCIAPLNVSYTEYGNAVAC